jgi:O-antigen ligase
MLTFLPFVIGPWNLDAAPFATPMWSGYVKGWQISLLDAVAFGIVVGTRGRWPRLVLVIPLLAYLLATFLAVFQARFPNLAFSYVVQLLRVVLVFLAAARVAEMERGERALLTGLIAGLTLQAGYAIWARLNGALQTGGSLGHQNLLGFVSHMALMPAFAMFLAGRWPRRALVGVLAGLIAVALTASRATIALAGFGLLLTLLLSLGLRFTGRKVAVGFAALVMVAVSIPLAQAALDRRFQAQKITFMTADVQRIAFERAAKAMIATNPLGVGPNHYVFIANTEGYSEGAGVNWSVGNRSAHVHNSYLLVAAESGYPGLITLVLLLFMAIFYAFVTAFRFRARPGAEVLIGTGAGLTAVVLHGFVEWMFVIFPAQYLFAASLGIISGLRSRFLDQQKAMARTRKAERSSSSFLRLREQIGAA